jgi:hypothetical protein
MQCSIHALLPGFALAALTSPGTDLWQSTLSIILRAAYYAFMI